MELFFNAHNFTEEKEKEKEKEKIRNLNDEKSTNVFQSSRPCKIHFKPASSLDLSLAVEYVRTFLPLSQASTPNRSSESGTTKGQGL
jgi:hypothetical protein